ncbi:MAG: hypothetical protein K9L64_04140 [Candidatus Izimaplasma sp.]|nr:hypothetical protein [Candidatus Izimaplasma bacterium]
MNSAKQCWLPKWLHKYADENYELNNYKNGIYINEAVELKGYDVNNSIEEQTQEIIDLLDALGYFVDVNN